MNRIPINYIKLKVAIYYIYNSIYNSTSDYKLIKGYIGVYYNDEGHVHG
jgi:hypothetical protein